MRGTKKSISFILVMILLMGICVACGSNQEINTQPSSDEKDVQQTVESSKKEEMAEDRVVTLFIDSNAAEKEETKELMANFEKATGIKIEHTVIPANGYEIYKKIDISMMSGDQTDVIGLSNAIIHDKYVQSDFLMPLNDLAKENSYDMETVFGQNLAKYDDVVYSLPGQMSIWAVFYNKKIFDEAGVPYPDGSWTWDEYIETAKKLTNPDKGIYGSYMLDYDCYLYYLARQKEVSGYKEDGASNYDDPAFAEALQFFGDLGNVHKIQPSWVEFKTKKYSWDQFMNGQFGMHFIGSWYIDLLNNPGDYPRDWDYGIAAIPANEDGKNNFGNMNYYAINKNAKHPEEAFELVKYLAETEYTRKSAVPARVDLTEDELNAHFENIASQSSDSITGNDLTNALINNGLGFVDEKFIGTASAEYSEIVLQEGELYLIGEQSIEDTVNNIKTRVDAAIESAN
ncbi:ABC transporter substrate-binding protein [Vallitalea okinawensis]|uniref:ABC transporter substrate-binding protein n=1 Tax=Vallitalea okinawensis TaxID=2078660 RepID=UPI000CFCAE74|nr:sugar ABC transporter substrate-binding protein [Vallitalea okinawensis]